MGVPGGLGLAVTDGSLHIHSYHVYSTQVFVLAIQLLIKMHVSHVAIRIFLVKCVQFNSQANTI